MTNTKDQSRGDAARPPEVVRWRHWPLRDSAATAWLAIAAAASVALAVGWFAGWAWSAVAAVAQCVPLWRLFVPTDYEVNDTGIDLAVFGRRRRLRWRSIRNWHLTKDGVILSPWAAPQPLDFLRDIHIPCAHHRDDLVASLEYYLTAG